MSIDEHFDAGQQPRTPEALGNLALRTMSTFACPINELDLFPPLAEAVTRACKPFAEIGAALRANIAGLLSTMSVPYTLAFRSAVAGHWQRIHSVARIRSLKLLAGPNETQEELEVRREREALGCARSEMANYTSSPEGRDSVSWDTLGFLENLRSDETVIRAADELILQGVVLSWGAFEVFARDCFISFLNGKPDRS
jgi:hypothetical protein